MSGKENLLKKVLLIEDNSLNRELVVDILEVEGFEVIQAESAEIGIELALSEPPDIILMDISLPGIDGLTATGILNQDSRTKHIPIIAMTAHVMSGDENKFLAAGCKGYIPKPLNIHEFPNIVKNLCGI